ncbi:hypothetical protein J8M20_23045 [Pseudoalteromonas luteoviolacea]|uniref:hypothetical protein n=1 Tax=Pseudoalteromonas luteoviolacea TaxID=43657 RepID=UPI001B37EA41|nr:hypothetical protein [Pseudoalteromonas luteoviolacea]MBQ4814263.1 hypothetical protein [Pseudoalteromonas luteoviolacea]
MNKDIKAKDLKLVVAGNNSGGDRGGPPALQLTLTAKELEKVAGGTGGGNIGGPPAKLAGGTGAGDVGGPPHSTK